MKYTYTFAIIGWALSAIFTFTIIIPLNPPLGISAAIGALSGGVFTGTGAIMGAIMDQKF